MNAERSGSSFNSSVASYQVSGAEDMGTSEVKNKVKDVLKSRIFLGQYLERRLPDQRIGYRDLVLLSAAEVELKKDLMEAQQKLRSVYPNTHWIGITHAAVLGCPPGVCLWTEIYDEPFGAFWFQIKSVKFRDEEIIVILKCLRHISESFLEIEPILTGSAKNIKSTRSTHYKKTTDDQPDSTAESFSDTYNEIVGVLKGALSINNVKDFLTFVFAFVIAIFTGSTAFVNFLGNFILALIREISIFVKNSTPMFLGTLDFFSKIVGGFYILLAMFFKPRNPIPQSRSVAFHKGQTLRSSNMYNDRSFD